MDGVKRETFLAMADQDVATARESINTLVEDYGENLTAMEAGDDEIDVLCSLIEFFGEDPIPPGATLKREAYLAVHLAVAVKMLNEERSNK